MSTGIVFRTNDGGRWGTGKGANLTPQEVDLNFWELLSRLTVVEGSVTRSISSVTVSGSQMTIHYTDATSDTITLPYATFVWKGEWLPATLYASLNIVTFNNSVYLVLLSHTSAGETIGFDPDAVNEDDQPLYQLMFSLPDPNAGTFDLVSEGDNLLSSNLDGWVFGYDGGEGPAIVSIDLQETHGMRSGAVIEFVQRGNDAIIIEPITGVSINYPADKSPQTRTQWSTIRLRQLDADQWVLSGDLADGTA